MSSDPAARAGALLEIDLGAIVSNWRLLAERAAPAQCAAVVKANAYGLGAAPVTRALAAAGCRLFFVATLDEGIALRAALGPEPEIAVFNGPLPGTAAEFAAHRDRKSTRLNSSHLVISYAVFCLKKKTQPSQVCRTKKKNTSYPNEDR